MASDLINEVSRELEQMHKQLHSFKSAVDYLSTAKVQVNSAVDAVKSAETYHQSKLKELDKVYSSLGKLVGSVEVVSDKIESVDFPEKLASIETQLKKTFKELQESRTATFGALDEAKETFTSTNERLDKLEQLQMNTARDISTRLLETSSFIEKEFDQLTKKLKSTSDSLDEMSESIKAKITSRIQAEDKNTLITRILIIACAGINAIIQFVK